MKAVIFVTIIALGMMSTLTGCEKPDYQYQEQDRRY